MNIKKKILHALENGKQRTPDIMEFEHIEDKYTEFCNAAAELTMEGKIECVRVNGGYGYQIVKSESHK